MVMLHLDNGQIIYNPKTKKAEKMILPSSSQKYSRTNLWVHGSLERNGQKCRIWSSSFFFLLLSHTKLLTSIVYMQTKAVIELFHTQNDIAFVAFILLSANWKEWWLWLVVVLQTSKMTPFWATKKGQGSDVYLLCIRSSHRICTRRTLLSGWSFLFMIYATFGAIGVLASMTCMGTKELVMENLLPSPLRWWIAKLFWGGTRQTPWLSSGTPGLWLICPRVPLSSAQPNQYWCTKVDVYI